MGKVSSKAFVLLDVLFGATLMIAVILLCSYFRQVSAGFYDTSACCRVLANAYYAALYQPLDTFRFRETYREVDTALLFTQPKTNSSIQRREVLEVLRGSDVSQVIVIGVGNAAA